MLKIGSYVSMVARAAMATHEPHMGTAMDSYSKLLS